MSQLVLLLGAASDAGRAFSAELLRRRVDFIPLTRDVLEFTHLHVLFDYVRQKKPTFIINAAGLTEDLDGDVSKAERERALCANTLLPQTLARVCLMRNTPWGHVSSGSIYRGAKVFEAGQWMIEPDLNRADLRFLLQADPPKVRGFTERDEPNHCFLCPPCSFYSGTKALAEKAIKGMGRCYVWRPGLLFSSRDQNHNYLSRLVRANGNTSSVQSATHVADFARACLDLWELRASYGTYNVVNPGIIATWEILALLKRFLTSAHRSSTQPTAHRSLSSNVLPSFLIEASKLLNTGVRMRPLAEAIEDALRHWEADGRIEQDTSAETSCCMLT